MLAVSGRSDASGHVTTIDQGEAQLAVARKCLAEAQVTVGLRTDGGRGSGNVATGVRFRHRGTNAMFDETVGKLDAIVGRVPHWASSAITWWQAMRPASAGTLWSED